MEITVIYIILILITVGIIFHIIQHLMNTFNQDATDKLVKEVINDPYQYVRTEEMCYFFRNMIYLYLITQLLISACNNNLKIEKKTNSIEITNVKK